jgi:hypothetical protein
VLFTVAFSWSLLTVELLNDHFDRISRARQILIFGERPFVDFRDPGYFLTLYLSAAAQAISGGRLVGEAVVDSAAMAVAVVLTFVLAARASRSTGVGLIAAGFTLIVAPRHYDYDKVLFYTSGLALAWRYAARHRVGTLLAAAIVTAVAGLFRYDNGLFLFAAIVTTVVACHWRNPGTLLQRAAVYAAAVVVILLPVALAWQRTIGLPEVARQIRTYAEIEGPRTEIFRLPPLRADAGASTLSALVSPENHPVLLYYAMVALLPIGLAGLVWRSHRRHGDSSFGHEIPAVAAAIVLGALVATFILRNPVAARVGSAAPVAAILAAWLAGPLVPPPGTGSRARPLVITLGGVAALGAALILTGSPFRVLRMPQTITAGMAYVRELTRLPPNASLLPDTAGMVAYIRACTPEGSRVIVDGFAPEVYYFAQRGFAGGMPVFFGGHWTAPRDQERTVQQLRREFVPLAIIDPAFASAYDRVGAYLSEGFVQSGVSSFGNPRAPAGGYQVLLRRGLGVTTFDSRWNLPCLSGWTPAG